MTVKNINELRVFRLPQVNCIWKIASYFPLLIALASCEPERIEMEAVCNFNKDGIWERRTACFITGDPLAAVPDGYREARSWNLKGFAERPQPAANGLCFLCFIHGAKHYQKWGNKKDANSDLQNVVNAYYADNKVIRV